MGVGSSAPYGHDGRSINLREVILRHGGEAQKSRNAFAAMPEGRKLAIVEFLSSLVLFPPDDTASDLDPECARTRLSAARARQRQPVDVVQLADGSGMISSST
jgi:hypothetical protein